MSTKIKQMLATLFYCEKCRKRWAGGITRYYLCQPCWIKLKGRAGKLCLIEAQQIQERRKQICEELEARRKASMVEAMKQAIKELEAEKEDAR